MSLFNCNPPPTRIISTNTFIKASNTPLGDNHRKDQTFNLPRNLLISGWGISIYGSASGFGTVGMIADLLIPQTGSTPESWYLESVEKNCPALPTVDPSQAIHLGRLMKVISVDNTNSQRHVMEETSAKAEEAVRRMPVGEAVLVLYQWGRTPYVSGIDLFATGSLYMIDGTMPSSSVAANV